MTRASELTDEQLADIEALLDRDEDEDDDVDTDDVISRCQSLHKACRQLLTEHAAQAERVRELEAECRPLREYYEAHRAYTLAHNAESSRKQGNRYIRALNTVEAHDARARAKGDANG